jgi:hypothetical protein
MCATPAQGGISSWLRRRPIAARSPGERPLSFEVLVGLTAVVEAIGGGKEEGAC